MGWKELLQQGKEVCLSTSSSKGEPNAIVVISLGMIDGKLLLGACQMVGTLSNIRENPLVCVVACSGDEYYRIKGRATLHASGRYFDSAQARNDGPAVKEAIVIEVDDVFDLDKATPVEKG